MKKISTIKVLALMEADTVTGPAKNLIEFCRYARTLDQTHAGLPAARVSIATFQRGAAAPGAARRDGATSSDGDVAPSQFVLTARESGVEVDVMWERYRFDTRVIGELRRIVELRAPDIIQTHGVKSHFLVKLSGLWRRHLWIAFHHGYTSTDIKMRFYNQLNRWSLPSAHRVITVCAAFGRQLTREGVAPERIRVRHNSINLNGATDTANDAGALAGRLGIGAGERVLLAVGRLSLEKGHADLVAALGQLRRTNPEIDFKLVIVGDGPERGAVESDARAQGIGERVVFAGHVGDVRPFYAMADALVLPSHSEGSPNVLLEAMAAGLPVVATAVGGVPEIVEDEESALLVAARDAHAMAAAVGRILSGGPLARRLASKASALVAERYTPDAYARAVVGIYRDLEPAREDAA